MKICMLLRNPFTRDARVLREARSLAAAGHDVTVLCLRAGSLAQHEERDGFHVARLVSAGAIAGPTISSAARGTAPRKLPRPAVLVWARDEMLSKRFAHAAMDIEADVYHAHDLNTLEPATRAARARGAKLVYDAHELYPDLTGLARGEAARWARLERRLIGEADAVIVPSAARADEMAKRYGATPIVVMNCPEARPAPPVAAQSDTLRLVYAGGFSPNRGLDNVVRAAALIDKCVLEMIGWGPLEDNLKAIAGSNVRFPIAVDPDDVVGTIARNDIGIAPYIPVGRNNELAAPNKLFEYLHAGLAVAGSDLPDIRRVVDEHDVGAVFDARDADSIARAIETIRPRLDEMKQNARAAAPKYSWQAQEETLLKLYSQL